MVGYWPAQRGQAAAAAAVRPRHRAHDAVVVPGTRALAQGDLAETARMAQEIWGICQVSFQ